MSDNTEDFRELINEKFKSVHTKIDLQFSGIKDTLDSIDTQVKKTNGKVLKLQEDVANLQINDAKKSINCPQHLARLTDIEDDISEFKEKINIELEEYNFFKKYPKIAVGTIAMAVLILLLGYSEVKTALINSTSNKNAIEVSSDLIEKNKNAINQNTNNDKTRTNQQNIINQELDKK